MNSNDAVNESDPVEHTTFVHEAQQPTQNPSNPEPCMSAHNDVQHDIIKKESPENDSGALMEQLEFSQKGKTMLRQEAKEPDLSRQEPTGMKSEHAEHIESIKQLSEEVQRKEGAGSETRDEHSVPLVPDEELATTMGYRRDVASGVSNNDSGFTDSHSVNYERSMNEGVHDGTVPILTRTENIQFSAETPESLRGNPYMLAASLTAPGSEHLGIKMEKDGPEDVTSDQNFHASGSNMSQQDETQRTNRGDDLCIVPINRFDSPNRHRSADSPLEQDGDERRSTDGEFVDDSDTWSDEEDDGEGDNEHIAELKSQVQRGIVRMRPSWKQRHEIFQDGGMEFPNPAQSNDNDDGQFWALKKIQHDQQFAQQKSQGYIQQQQPLSTVTTPQQSSEPHSSNIQSSRNHAKKMNDIFSLSPFNMPGEAPAQSQVSQGTVQTPQNHAPYRHHVMGYQNIDYPTKPYVQYPYHTDYLPLPVSQYEMHARPSRPPPSNDWPPRPYAFPAQHDVQHHGAPQGQPTAEDEDDNTHDNRPLRTRVQRRPSMVKDSVCGSPSPALEPVPQSDKGAVGEDSEAKIAGLRSREELSNVLSVKKAPAKELTAPQPAPPHSNTQSESTSIDDIDWKLPEYEAVYTPAPSKNDQATAKVSLPGLVREELLLSPDHAEQEVHLLLNIFMPAQKALIIPEPSPAQALLNFHTIAIMVVEAYVQYEIGDEFGTGRGHWHDAHDMGDGEYERLRNAKDADPDEIFFAVIDRWRAAMESGKSPAKLIRGAQEFCDTALDVVYYIKEHGLLARRVRAARSDKGVKRGARKVREVEDDGEKKGTKRKVDKVNEVQVRKKTKVEKEKEKPKKEPVKRKSRAKEPALTVIKAPRKK